MIFSLQFSLTFAEEDQIRRFDDKEYGKSTEGLYYDQKPDPEFVYVESEEDEPQKNSKVGAVIVWILLIAALVLLLIIVARSIVLQPVKRKSLVEESDQEIDLENLHLDELTRRLLEAEGEQNWRLALRLLFVILVKSLADNGKIKWAQDKTNRDYLREARSWKFYSELRDATYFFERISYGDAYIDGQLFSDWKPRFQDLTQKSSGRS